MHNLHYVVVKAKTGEDACSEAEGNIEDWGNENNWRTVCGAVSQDNEVYKAGDGRWEPDDADTIEGINKSIDRVRKQAVELKDSFGHDLTPTLKEIQKKNFDKVDHMDFYRLQKWASAMSSVRGWKDNSVYDKFNILEDEHMEGHFDEFGATNMVNNYNDEDEKIWVVYVDMHS